MPPGTIRGILSLSRPDRFFLIAGLLFGAVFAAVTPPFQVPDEPAHFYRAYRVSEGRLDLVPAGLREAMLPASVHRIGTDLLGNLPFHNERRIAPRTILAAFQVPLAPERRDLVFFANSLQYTFVPYIPQAAGIAAGRLLGAPPLALLYLGRLTNLLFGVLIVAFAIRRLPAFQWLTAMVALTPMGLSLLGSASADVTSIAAAFTLVSTVAKLAWGAQEPRRGDFFLLAASAVALCASKPPYMPLTLLAVLIPAGRFPWRRTGFILLQTALALAAAAWSVVTSRSVGTIRIDAGVDVNRQIHDSLTHPFGFLWVLIHDYAVHTPQYLGELVGKLGWLDTKIPIPLRVVYLAVLLALVFLDASPEIEVRRWQRGIAATATLAAMAIVSASQYAIWTRYGADLIEGIQGRYFLPLVPGAVWALHGRRWAGRIPPGRLRLALAAFSLLTFGIAVRALVGRYYGV
jgi:uncharacterized membrane protein